MGIEKMDRNIFTDKLVSFCFDYAIFDMWENEHDIKSKIASGLDKAEFIEILIQTIHTRLRACKKIEIERVAEIFAELEGIRTMLEYQHKNYIFDKNSKNSEKSGINKKSPLFFDTDI